MVAATGFDQAAENFRVGSAVTIGINARTGHDHDHAVKFTGSLRLPGDKARFDERG